MIKSKITVVDGFIKSIEPSRTVELVIDGNYYAFEGCSILPGLTDSHCHVWGLGMVNSGMDLSVASSEIETLKIAKLNDFRKGEWILGRGWNNELWENTDLPTKSNADIVFPDSPIALTRIDGHSIWCNSKALELAGINSDTIDLDGGKIIRDENGLPTGLLIDNAMNLLDSKIPDYTDEQLEKFILTGLDLCVKAGLTAVHDVDVSSRMVDIYKRLNEHGKLPLRVYAFVSCQNDEAFESAIEPYYSEYFTIKGIKLYSDGALGSYGAALLEDYCDKPGEKGLILMNADNMSKKMIKAAELGLDIAVHAIGDRANREVLDAFDILLAKNPNIKSKLRMEHSQIVDPSDIARFKKMNVNASVQSIHFVGDAVMAEKRLGSERLLKSGYLWKSFEDAGVLLLGGSDFPIESHNPFLGINAFVNRQNNLNIADELKRECLSLESALKCYTLNPYIALGIESNGKLAPNYKADFTIIKDGTVDDTTIVEAVFVNGEKKYGAD